MNTPHKQLINDEFNRLIEEFKPLPNKELGELETAISALDNETTGATKSEEKTANILEAIHAFFRDSLEKAEEGEEIKKYIKSRNLEGIEEIGYIPTRESLKSYLAARYSLVEYTRILSKLHGNIGKTHRLTIAYRDISGSIIGFIFRQLQSEEIEGVGKYLYSTGLAVGRHLFNLNHYKRGESVIIVEGIIDALISQKEGINNVIAIGSSTLSREQARLLAQLKPRDYTLALDNDEAGKNGTIRAIKTILETDPHARIYITELPDDIKDPDQLIRERGAEALRELIEVKEPYYSYLAHALKVKHNIHKGGNPTPENILNFADDALEISLSIKNPFEADFFVKGVEKWTDGIITSKTFEEAREKRLKKLQQERQRREFYRLLREAENLDRQGDTQKAIETLKNKIETMKKEEAKDAGTTIMAIKKEEQHEEARRRTPGDYGSGYVFTNGLNTMELYIPAGAMTVIAARPGHGKTTMLLNLSLNLLDQLNGKPLYIFSYEESEEDITEKLMNIYINKDFRHDRSNLEYIRGYYRNGGETYKNPDFLEGKKAFWSDIIGTGKVKIHHGNEDINTLTEIIELIKEHDNAGAVVIDYLQYIPPEDAQAPRQLAIQSITQKLAKVAVKTGLPIITASQLNRQAATQDDLTLDKMRESGDIEQDANLVIGLWNNKGNKLATQRDEGIYLEVLKNRNGPIGMTAELDYNENTGKISNPRGFA